MSRNTERRPTMMENVNTVNSAVRTVLMIGVAGCLGFGGWMGYSEYILPGIEGKKAKEELVALKAEHEKLEVDLAEATIENDKLKFSMALLKIDRRVAQLTVDKKGVDEDGQKFLEVTFSEVDGEGNVIGSSREFTLKGHSFYVDSWVAQFQDKYVEQADALRGASIFTFKTIYGDEMAPADGFSLEDFSKPAGIFSQSEASEFAAQIWEDFGNVCNNRDLQDELGIRAVSGHSNFLPPVEGRTYEITIRSSGSVNVVPVDDVEAND